MEDEKIIEEGTEIEEPMKVEDEQEQPVEEVAEEPMPVDYSEIIEKLSERVSEIESKIDDLHALMIESGAAIVDMAEAEKVDAEEDVEDDLSKALEELDFSI